MRKRWKAHCSSWLPSGWQEVNSKQVQKQDQFVMISAGRAGTELTGLGRGVGSSGPGGDVMDLRSWGKCRPLGRL